MMRTKPILVLLTTAIAVLAAVAAVVTEQLPERSAPDRLKVSDVPSIIVASVHAGEARSRADHDGLRTSIENGQHLLADHFPLIASHANFSIGEFGLKPRTVVDKYDFAIGSGYLPASVSREEFAAQVVDDATDPARACDCAALLIAYFKQAHPRLAEMTWEQIANDDQAIAKLYSAYVGGDQQLAAWQSCDQPGPVAANRLGYEPESQRCVLIDDLRQPA